MREMLTCNKCGREIDGEQYCGDCMADICAERSGSNYRIAALEAELATSYERGAREFAEWFDAGDPNPVAVKSIPRWLAARAGKE